jgi:hypothetical protein
MRKDMLCKTLVMGVILLFVGVVVQPAFAIETISINENKSKDDELIEVTFRICKLTEVIEHTVLLTQEESDKLDKIIDNVKNDLEKTTDVDEEKEIKKNAVESFDNLGLLPDNTNSEEVQELVSNNIYYKLRNKVKSGSFKYYESDGFSNSFCTITGESNTTGIFTALSLPFMYANSRLFNFYLKNEDTMGPILRTMIGNSLKICFILMALFMRYGNISFFGGAIMFGGGNIELEDDNPASGWIHTDGTNGEKSFEGEWFGQLKKLALYVYFGAVYLYLGVTGFIGIQLEKGDSLFYMGYALKVHIGTERPVYNPRGRH